MASSQTSLLSFLLSVSSLLGLATSTESCPERHGGCGNSSSPLVKFPFQIKNDLGRPIGNPRCGYPGFQLSCYQNQTFLILPRSGPFTVLNIDYKIQTLYINDPKSCLPKRYLDNFSVLDSPFTPHSYANFTFLNCSSNSSATAAFTVYGYSRGSVPCLSGENYTVLAVPSWLYDELYLLLPPCEVIRTVKVPVSWDWTGLEGNIPLKWTVPNCENCENRGGVCGFQSDSGLHTGCFAASTSGMSRGTKYAIIIGAGVPGALFIIGLGCCLCCKAGTHRQHHHRQRTQITELSTSITPPPPVILVAGLDRPTIESYPKTLLGESRRLPKPNDNTCPICLSEYEPKETLRTIPECNHYFHADCIDIWLRTNASCPVCRNSPEGSYFVTPSSTSTSSASPRSSSVLSP